VILNTTAAAPPPTPAAPALVSPAQGATPPQPVTLDWNDVSAATSYRVQVDDSSNFSAPRVVEQTVTASQLTLPTLAARGHWWRVRGVNSAGVAGPWSTVRSFTPQGVAAAPALSTISLNPTTVVGGSTSQGTARLTAAAPAGGAVVALTSSNTSVATVPASVTVAAGTTSATFTVTTAPVATSSPAVITGSYGGATRSATLTVNASGSGSLPAPTLLAPASDARFNAGQTIAFDWSDVTGASSYTIQIDDRENFGSPVVNQSVTSSSYSTSTLPVTRMWFRVRAVDAAGVAGAWSGSRRFEVR
jgi:hypothetical protein